VSKEEYTTLKIVLLDMDGVLWRGPDPILDISELFTCINANNLSAFCITNNSTSTVDCYLRQLNQYGVSLDEKQVITSAEATADYLAMKYPAGGLVYVVGEQGLLKALQNQNFFHVENPRNENIIAVAAGLDRGLTYEKIEHAARLINQGVPFIGTNPDRTIPTPEGIAPGAGAIIKAIETASGTAAEIIGKPKTYLFNLALQRAGCLPGEAIMIGDRLETDIAGAQNIGMRTGLVLSGVTDRSTGEAWNPPPDLIADNALNIIEKVIAHEI
jgi:4-nitrophenyl phosphatase